MEKELENIYDTFVQILIRVTSEQAHHQRRKGNKKHGKR